MSKGKLQTDYLMALDVKRLDKILRQAKKQLSKVKFDAIAFSGLSGAIVAPLIAFRLDKGLIAVRKSGHASHSACKVEGHIDSSCYIIVDDFIYGGGTVRHIAESIRKHNPDAILVGIYEYLQLNLSMVHRWSTPKKFPGGLPAHIKSLLTEFGAQPKFDNSIPSMSKYGSK